VIVRWSLAELPDVLEELGLERPFLVASPRWTLDVRVCGRWSEVPSREIEVPAEADSLLAVGGGSAIDTAKNASAQTGLPVVSVPTTYSGAEWTPTFGIRSPDRRMVGGGGAGA
jgi:maleylacetate reductase